MSEDESTRLRRRDLLQLAAALSAAGTLGSQGAVAAARTPEPTGRSGDFEFLTGTWKIRNRRLVAGAFDEFESEATVFSILGGLASVEELRIPARGFSGMGLRLLDVERRLWADFWVNSKSGILTTPPVWGSFVDGIGRWDQDDEADGAPIIVRGVWDQITPTACRWYQAVSRDDGQSWAENWVMHWARS